MSIALTLNNEEIITPIVEGTKLRIINEQDWTWTDYANPALSLTEGRRSATLRFAIAKGAQTFVAPPETFCELSYKRALEHQIQFYSIEAGKTFSEFSELFKNGLLQAKTEIKNEELAPDVKK